MNDINRRAVPRFAHAPGPGAGTSLTPYGMSFWALILAACGGGGGGGASTGIRTGSPTDSFHRLSQ
jgi:hypothetical protein